MAAVEYWTETSLETLDEAEAWFEDEGVFELDQEGTTELSEWSETPFGLSERDDVASLSLFEEAVQLETGPGSSLTDRVRSIAAFTLGPSLKQGANGPAVAALQRALVALGHDLAVDGVFGPNTERSVRDFQRGATIAADGVVGPQTKAAIARPRATVHRPRAGGRSV